MAFGSDIIPEATIELDFQQRRKGASPVMVISWDQVQHEKGHQVTTSCDEISATKGVTFVATCIVSLLCNVSWDKRHALTSCAMQPSLLIVQQIFHALPE